MKKILLIPVLALFAISLFMAAGCRQHGHHGNPEKMAERIVNYLTDELDLDGFQEAKLTAASKEVLAKIREGRESRKARRTEAIAKIRNGELTENYVLAAIREREDAQRELSPFIAGKVIELYAILTPEQRIKLADMMEEFHNRHF